LLSNFLTLLIRGRRECRAPDAPAAARAMIVVERTRVSQVTPESPGIPRAMVLRFPSCSPRRSGSFATVTGGIASTDLTPASRCQDHTTSPSASASPVSRAKASTASRPDVRDVRETPLCVGRDIDGYILICSFGKSEYFYQRGFTDFWVICPTGRFVESLEEIGVRKNSWPVIPGCAQREPGMTIERGATTDYGDP